MVILAFLVRVTLAVTFLRAGLLKLLGVAEFKRAIHNYRLIPGFLVSPVSLGVVIAELVGGGMLLLGVELRPVSIVLTVLLLIFCCAISVNLLRGRIISCGCSGSVAKDITWKHVVSNVGLAGAVTLIAFWPAEPLSVLPGLPDAYQDPAWTRRVIAAVLLLTLAAAAGLLLSETRRARHALSRFTREEVS